MKTKATKKYIRELYGDKNIINIGYCNLQNLLHFETPAYYCTRAEGWACDCYIVNDYIITTGYAPFGKIQPAYSIQKKFDDAAYKVFKQYKKHETKQKHVTALLNKFIEEVTTK